MNSEEIKLLIKVMLDNINDSEILIAIYTFIKYYSEN